MIELCAVGDISPGDHYFLTGHGVGSTFNDRGPDFLFENIRKVITGSDITFGNLEGVLSHHGLDTNVIESVAFRGNPNMADSLRKAGFDILNIANNHILQHGRDAFEETVSVLRQNEIIPLGLASSNGFSSVPAYFEAHGLTIGFLGYSLVSEMYHPQQHLYARGPVEQILKDISKLSQEVDVPIVSIHHGLEGMKYPSPYGALLSRMFVDAGARVVLSHHPHVFQAVEEYRKGIICHSLGNFLFDLMWYAPLTYGSVVKIQIRSDDHLTYSLHPFRINQTFQPTPLEGDEKTIYQSKIDRLNSSVWIADYDTDSYSYYNQLRTLENCLARRKFIFMFTNLLKGNTRLKIQFILKKVGRRLLNKL